jgi:hypothetical protein
MWTGNHTVVFRDFQELIGRKPGEIEESDTESIPEKNSLYCAACNFKITYEKQKIAMRGKTEHTFFNPYGNVFHIQALSNMMEPQDDPYNYRDPNSFASYQKATIWAWS